MTIEIEWVAGTVSGFVAKYVGYAAPGSLTSNAVWRIVRLTYDANDNPTKVEWANGNNGFVNIWDNRAALAYS